MLNAIQEKSRQLAARQGSPFAGPSRRPRPGAARVRATRPDPVARPRKRPARET